jgi:hypothetical protein
MKSFTKYLLEIYRITPKRRDLLNNLESDAVDDLRVITQQKDKALNNFYNSDDIDERDENELHNILFNSSTTYNALSKLARLRRIEAIKQQGLPIDRRKDNYKFFGSKGPQKKSDKPSSSFLKKISKNERIREKHFRAMGTPPNTRAT